MPTLDCATDRRDGVTLVECVVHNDTTDRRRVRVRNRLEGPVRGPPEGPDWTDGATTCTLAPGERAALGYATPAPPQTPPADLTDAVADRGEEDATLAPVSTPTADRPDDGPVRPDGAGVALPPAVETWLSALEERVAAVEAGHREPSPGPATVVVDRETLAALEERAADLCERLTAARDGDA